MKNTSASDPTTLPLSPTLFFPEKNKNKNKNRNYLSPVTKEAAARYELSLRKAAAQGPELAAAERAVASASHALAAEASWFWRFQGEEKRGAVAKARARERAARARLEKLYLRGDEAVREGKQALGLWSQAGVDESRRTFKRAFESGKVFARRQTLWVRRFCFFFIFRFFVLFSFALTLSLKKKLFLSLL